MLTLTEVSSICILASRGTDARLAPSLKYASRCSSHSLASCSPVSPGLKSLQFHFYKNLRANLIVSVSTRRKQGLPSAEIRGILMTDMMTVFQKHLFGFTKASTNLLVTLFSVFLASLHVVLIPTPSLSLENIFLLLSLTHLLGISSKLTYEKPILIMQWATSFLSWTSLGFIDHS